MALTPLLVTFFGGLLVIFLTGRLIGHFTGLDKYFSDEKTPDTSVPYKNYRKRKGQIKGKKDRHLEGSQGTLNTEHPGQEYAKSDNI